MIDTSFLPKDGGQPCTTVDPEIFLPKAFAGRGHTVEEASAPAIALCRRCFVVRECLAYALAHDVQGVWGGSTERQRKELRRRHATEPVGVPA